jgi:hypothetical protein
MVGVLKFSHILPHLACFLAGWGIVAALRPLLPAEWNSKSSQSPGLPTKTERPPPSVDPAGGERLLKRLIAALPPSEKIDPFSVDSDPFSRDSEDPSTPPPSLQQFVAEALREIGLKPDGSLTGPDSPLAGAEAEARHDVYLAIVTGGLDGACAWHNGRDLDYSFRHGRVTAMEIHDDFAALLPGPAASDDFRRCLYDHLALLNPDAASVLLDSLPEKDATGAKYWAVREHRSDFDPDGFLAVIETIPAPGDAAAIASRQSAWSSNTPRFLKTHGGDYFRWVETLPAGSDRDLAAEALLDRLKDGDPADYNRVRAAITDPAIQRRFAPR